MDNSKLILTICDSKYEDNLVNDFLPSLRHEGKYDGNIVILDCGLNNPIREDVSYVPCKRLPDFQQTVNELRAQYFLSIIAERPEAKQIGYFDCGDLWFQDSIEELFQIDGLGLTEEREISWSHPFWQGVLNQINLGDEFRTTLDSHVIRNAGVFIGDRNSIIALLTKQVEYTSGSSHSPWGIDQAIYNYLWHKGEAFKSFNLLRKYNFITFAHPWYIDNNKLYDSETKELVVVVHNAGSRAAPRLYQL